MGKDRGKHFNTYEEAAEWFNSHDMTDFEDQLEPVDFKFDLRKNRDWVELERELAVHLRKIAIKKRIPTRILVNQLLKERLRELRRH
jgi:hypothetical protein